MLKKKLSDIFPKIPHTMSNSKKEVSKTGWRKGI
jgi:hypothetical protein